MSDLSELQASESVKLAGANSSGVETFFADVTSDGRLKVHNAITEVSHVNRIDVTSAARTTSGDSGTLDSNGFGMAVFFINITAVSGTTPTMQISFDVSEDGSNWSELIKTVRFTAATTYREQRISLSAKYYRYRWTIAGTTPSFTFSMTSTLKPYSPNRNVVVSQYADLNLTATNNVSSSFTAADCSNVSIMTIRAADGGNNGQFKVQGSNTGLNWGDISSNITQGANTTILTTFTGQSFRYYRLIVASATNAGTRVLDIHWGAS